MDKLYSVKGYIFEEKQEVVILDEKSKTKPPKRVRKMTVFGTDLSFKNAKELRNQHKEYGAEIFPNVKKQQLKIVQLSEMV